MAYKSFQDYLEAKNGNMKPVEKPPVEKVPDYKGPANPLVKKAPERKNCCGGEDGKKLAGTPKTEEIPDFHGKVNPEAREFKAPKNVKKSQVVEISSFAEYLNAKGNMEEPKVTLNVNFTQPEGPNSGMPGPSGGKPLSYVAKSEKGEDWGKMGANEPYVPKTDVKKDTKVYTPDQKKTNQQPQAESILKNMSLVEVTSFLQKQNDLLTEEGGCPMCDGIPKVTAWSAGKIMPDPLETIEYISHLASQNTELMEHLIRKLKGKKGGMGSLIERLLGHPETMKELVTHIDGDKGPDHAGDFARAMSDTYHDYMRKFSAVNESALSPAIGFGDDVPPDDDDDEDDENSYDDHDLDDEEMEPEDSSDLEDEDGEDDDDLPEMPSGEEKLDDLPKKPSKKFAHHHLISAMGQHKYQLDAMKDYCKDCE